MPAADTAAQPRGEARHTARSRGAADNAARSSAAQPRGEARHTPGSRGKADHAGESGRRRHHPAIPAHIDQSRLPPGIYFDARGRGRWYRQYRDEANRLRRRNVADAQATLDELRQIAADRDGLDRDSLAYLAAAFHAAEQFQQLAPRTQQDYAWCRKLLIEMPTKLGKPLGELPTRQFQPALVQRLVDRIASDGTPAKANHLLRYLRRLFRWGINRGYCDTNPARGVEAARERRRRRLPELETVAALTEFARERGQRRRGEAGACAPYLWIVMELAYICRLRGIEVVTLTDAHHTPAGVHTNRRKGSRDSVIRWYPRLRHAWDAATRHRDALWRARALPVPQDAAARPLIVAADGAALQKSSLDSAWQRFIRLAIAERVIRPEQRFGLHDLKRRGITDTAGTRHDKLEASGHRSAAMMDVYDLSVPLVPWPGYDATAP
ncbi:phage integrase central domain-containing protein [Salinicola endophyticus]|uniref:phage integrase central domain-containing protein n=1 Tax=Salinicola endophyticus TaxID=1949083 RepID=UPI00249BAAF0|nr:hypothetical protein [Salinicola endophyticus]